MFVVILGNPPIGGKVRVGDFAFLAGPRVLDDQRVVSGALHDPQEAYAVRDVGAGRPRLCRGHASTRWALRRLLDGLDFAVEFSGFVGCDGSLLTNPHRAFDVFADAEGFKAGGVLMCRNCLLRNAAPTSRTLERLFNEQTSRAFDVLRRDPHSGEV